MINPLVGGIVMKRSIIREGNRFKVYLPKELNDLWREVKGKKVHLVVVLEPANVTAKR